MWTAVQTVPGCVLVSPWLAAPLCIKTKFYCVMKTKPAVTSCNWTSVGKLISNVSINTFFILKSSNKCIALHRDVFYISIVWSLKMRLNTHWLLAAGYWLLASPIADRFVDFLQSNKQKTRNSNQEVPLDSDVSFVLSAYFVVTL